MIGKLIGAAAGSHFAKYTSGVGGAGGAVLGAGAAALARRASLPVLVAVAAGGYLVKRHLDKREAAGGTSGTAGNAKAQATRVKGAQTSQKSPSADKR